MQTGQRIRFGKLVINPALSPGVLDTATWDGDAAWELVRSVDDAYWLTLRERAAERAVLPATALLTPHARSCTWRDDTLFCLASLVDGQQVFLALGAGAGQGVLGRAIGARQLQDGAPASAFELALYPTDAATIDRFCRTLAPEKGPRALGPVPRLGAGTRMTTAVWPAIWQAMAAGGFAANAIQNSVRELNFLDSLLAGQPAERNIAFGFGAIESGYTGSSFEGLWVAGVLDALKHAPYPQPDPEQAGGDLRYGADADHIQVKRGPDGLARAKRMLDATRYYSFYTLDVSDVLTYAAMSAGATDTISSLEAQTPDPAQRRALLTFHQQPRRFGGFDYRPDSETLGRLVGKYWVALQAVEETYAHICGLKNGVAFDLELSIDEHPNEVPTFDCLTSETELIFVLLEAQRRSIPLTHVAPNFGVEKGTDYRGPDGLPGFEARVRALCHITEEFGVMPDFHSGDDLSPATRQVIGRATGGRNHFKVSPNLQLLFGEVLAQHHPDLFQRWYADARAYAQREAASGSTFAARCLQRAELADKNGLPALAHDDVFHHFSFAFVGRRDAGGQFVCREEFYALSPAFYRAYQECIAGYLGQLAEDLLLATR
ncbi:MAG: hypothetical protein H3C34_18970 [Caldilineaceae bacterium]|nr:hypothetical protein [Caldilineaceae bacterium]